MISLPRATILLVLLLAPLAYGQDVNIDFDDQEFGYEYCKWMSLLAKDIMTMRQNGKPMSETLPNALNRLDNMIVDIVESMGLDLDDRTEEEMAELNAESEASMREIKPFITQLVIGSYDVPAYSVSALQRDVINETENAVFGSCYQGFQEEISLD